MPTFLQTFPLIEVVSRQGVFFHTCCLWTIGNVAQIDAIVWNGGRLGLAAPGSATVPFNPLVFVWNGGRLRLAALGSATVPFNPLVFVCNDGRPRRPR